MCFFNLIVKLHEHNKIKHMILRKVADVKIHPAVKEYFF